MKNKNTKVRILTEEDGNFKSKSLNNKVFFYV